MTSAGSTDVERGKLTRRGVLAGATSVAAVAATGAPGAAAHPAHDRARGRRHRLPNVVLVYVDDLGYGDLGCYGSPLIETPTLDGMARRGMRFTDFYSGNPVCTPSRAALLSGAYAARVNLPNVLFPVPRNDGQGIAPQETLLPEYLRREGYATGMFGKWHLGDPRSREQFHPMRNGFDRFYGIPYSNDMTPLPFYDGYEVVEEPPAQEPMTRRLTEQAVEFVREHADEPFFVYLAHPQPHEPLAAESVGRSAAGPHGDAVEEIDHYLGVLLDELDELGIRDDTCVIFSSDNGPWFVGSPGDLHGRKAECYEGGMRVPFVVEWPGVVPRGRVYREPAQIVDVLPTLLEAIDTRPDPHREIDGVSLLRAWRTGRRVERGDIYYFGDVEPISDINAIRHGDWKLHVGRVVGPYFTGRGYEDGVELPQLFDLRRDELESYDLADHYPEVVEELTARIERFDVALRADHDARYLSLALTLPQAVGGQVDHSATLTPTLVGPDELADGATIETIRLDGRDVPPGHGIDAALLSLGRHRIRVAARSADGTHVALRAQFLVVASIPALMRFVQEGIDDGRIGGRIGARLASALQRAARAWRRGHRHDIAPHLSDVVRLVPHSVRDNELRRLLLEDARALLDDVRG